MIINIIRDLMTFRFSSCYNVIKEITDLRAEKIPSDNQYLLRWSIYPVTCPLGPRLVVASVNDSLQTP